MKFQTKISLIIIIILGLLAWTGSFSYKRFNKVLTELQAKSKPDGFLLFANTVSSEVSRVENLVVSYRLTEDTTYLNDFYERAGELSVLVDSSDDHDYDPRRKQFLDSLRPLVGAYLLHLQLGVEEYQLYRVQDALVKVESEFRQNQAANQTLTTRRSLLKKLLSRKGRQSEEISKDQELVNAMRDISRQESRIEKSTKADQTEFLSENDAYKAQIFSLISSVESVELNRISAYAGEADLALKRSRQKVVLFLVAMAIFLLVMTYLLVQYVRQGQLYRMSLQREQTQIKELAQQKERFLANISHELRTPLNAVIGFAEQLNGIRLDDSSKKMVEMLQFAADHLLHLANELLDYTKLNENKLRLNQESFLLIETMNRCLAMGENLKGQGQQINAQLNIPENLQVNGDRHRLKQIILNLLSNAVKFSPGGTVEVKVDVQLTDQAELLIEVKDNGVGMSPDQLEQIFKPYVQSDASISATYGGTGLGLAITHELVQLHGGNISVESELEKGTRFEVTIPYSNWTTSEHEKQTSLPSDDLKEIQRVLIVDDEEYNRKLIRHILEKHGVHCQEAENGDQAWEIANQSTLDLVITDLRMPEANGLDLLKNIRAHGDAAIRSLPVIVLSAAYTDQDKEQLKANQVNGILTKPIREKTLLKLIQFTPNKSEASEDVVHDGPVSFRALQDVAQGNMEFYVEMLETFLSDFQKELEHLNTALGDLDLVLTQDIAHKMCSPARHLRCQGLLKHLKSIENAKDISQVSPQLDKLKNEYAEVSELVKLELKKASL